MLKAYKYKIMPNAQQEELLSKFFGCTRFIYNWGLDMKTSAYKQNGKALGYMQLAHELTKLKQDKEHQWLNECTTEALQQSLRSLDKAFTSFFRKKAKYPRFKSKKKSKDSAKFINCVHFDFDNWTVRLPKLGKVKMCKNRTFDQSVCKQGTCTVSRDHCGTYWCVITVDYDTICLENLNVDGMMQNHHLAMAIQGASWSEFVRQLEYKSEFYGKNVLFIGRFEPSSKLCHKCGYINQDLKLSDRKWICPECGESHDRDVNAAMNIKEIAFDKQNLVGV